MKESKTCDFCNEPITIGRFDKRYCDDNCRANYHNKKHREKEASVRLVISILRKNWKILKLLNPSGHTTVRKSYLIEHGYNFNYFTNIYKTAKGNGRAYYFCFDMGFCELENSEGHKVNIVNWQPYMEEYKLPVGFIGTKP